MTLTMNFHAKQSDLLNSFIGLPISEIPTPALVVDLAIFEENLSAMSAACAAQNKRWRPHGKAHKSLSIAAIQQKFGATGLCAAKLGEAEIFVLGGFRDILITAPVVGSRKIERLLKLNETAPDLKVVCDSRVNLQEISAAAVANGQTIKVMIDVNVGQNRTGVGSAEQAIALADICSESPGLELSGIQAYAGNNQHMLDFFTRRAAELESLGRAIHIRELIKRAGFSVDILSVGGTGTADIDLDVSEVTEIQPGSFLFMDAHYNRVKDDNSTLLGKFTSSLSVYTTIISRPSADRAITDGGNKALSIDEGFAVAVGLRGANYRPGGDEHGILDLVEPNMALNVGDKLQFTPGHCDTTVNLYDFYFGVRSGKVETVWPIEARGRLD